MQTRRTVARGTVLLSESSQAVPTLYYSRSDFLSDGRVTTTTILDFDSTAAGTDLTGQTLSGAQLNGTSLTVISAATGVRNPMNSSTPPNILSPGGSDPTIENDDLEVVFDTPVQAAGLDVVWDVDVSSFVSVTFYDSAGNVIASNGFIPDAPEFQFVGLVADSPSIKRMVFDDFDPSAPDDNVAYDSIVFSRSSNPVPEGGATLWIFALSLIPICWGCPSTKRTV